MWTDFGQVEKSNAPETIINTYENDNYSCTDMYRKCVQIIYPDIKKEDAGASPLNICLINQAECFIIESDKQGVFAHPMVI